MWNNAVVIITGGASGIGKALAISLAGKGAQLHICDKNQDGAAAVAAACGSKARAHFLDVTDSKSVHELVQGIHQQYGAIHFLFNNAGIGIGGEVQEIGLNEWDAIIDINIKGVIHGIQAVYPLMIQQGFGHIINTASLAGLGPAPLLTPYAMTKHAVVGLSESLRLEAKSFGIHVSVLCPSAIETPILDKDNPLELKNVRWNPNVRRYLPKLAGPPYPADRFAEEAIKQIEKRKSIIVIPGQARIAHFIGKYFPKLAEMRISEAMMAERKART